MVEAAGVEPASE